MYALIFVLAMALTGLTWSFDWYRSAFYAVCGVEHTPRNFTQSKTSDGSNDGEKRDSGSRRGRHYHGGAGRHEGGSRHEGGGRHRSEFGRWQEVYETLKAQNPEAPQITISSEKATVTLGYTGNGRAADSYEFNRRTGELSLVTKYADANEADRLRGWIYSIHTGSLGGLFTRILWLLGALLGASLPLTGYYIWIKHLLKNKRHHKA